MAILVRMICKAALWNRLYYALYQKPLFNLINILVDSTFTVEVKNWQNDEGKALGWWMLKTHKMYID